MIDPDELLFTVDEDNNPIEPKPRDFVHRNGYWHRNSHVWIVNKNKEILCHQRSLLKDNMPGLWSPSFGGHIPPEVEYVDHATKELNEELGITVEKEKLKLIFIYKHESGKEFQAIYKLMWEDSYSSIKLKKDEIEQVKWFSKEELVKQMKLNPQEWAIIGYEQKLFGLLFNK